MCSDAALRLAAQMQAQQTYVTRFYTFAGYTYLNSPRVGLVKQGFHTQAGVRVRKWLTVGFDYSVSTGDLNLTRTCSCPPSNSFWPRSSPNSRPQDCSLRAINSSCP
jgi:hypothetical protein